MVYELLTHSTGMALGVAGLASMGYGSLSMANNRPEEDESGLVKTGAYGLNRHPQYLGYRLISLGAFALYPSMESLALSIITFGLTERTARIEEKKMMETFGEEYAEYMKNVPRWFPYKKIKSGLKSAIKRVRDSA